MKFVLHPWPAVVLTIANVLMTGCMTTAAHDAAEARDFTTTAAMVATGAYVGTKEGNGKARDAALGAAAGFVGGEAIGYFNNKAQRDAFQSGYQKGQSDAVKQQYWIARDNQRRRSDDGYEEALYQIDVPASEHDGVRREPTTRVIRVVVPKPEEQR